MISTSQNAITELLEFWFSERVEKFWFNSTKTFDEELRQKYLPLLEQAEQGQLNVWQQTPLGSLALVIVLDQLPLNLFRQQARSFATESQARDVAQQAIDNGFDAGLSDKQKAFLYLPFMHSENMSNQDRSVELFEKAGLQDNLKYAKHHRSIVKRFGRFPHRNKILGRDSTPDEVSYLNSKEAFLG